MERDSALYFFVVNTLTTREPRKWTEQVSEKIHTVVTGCMHWDQVLHMNTKFSSFLEEVGCQRTWPAAGLIKFKARALNFAP